MDKLTVRHILLTLLEEWLEMTLKFKKKEFNGDTRDLRTMDIIAHAEAALNEIYKPMSKEEIGEKLAQAYCLANHSHKILDPSLIREQVKLLYPHLRLSEAQIDSVLPKEKSYHDENTDMSEIENELLRA